MAFGTSRDIVLALAIVSASTTIGVGPASAQISQAQTTLPTVTGKDRQAEIERLYSVLSAPQNMYPASVGIGMSRQSSKRVDRFFCNGVLVRAQWVLTASYCVENANAKQLVVFYGSPDLETAQEIGVMEVVRRAATESRTQDNVALLKLAQPITIQPIDLATQQTPPKLQTERTANHEIGRAAVAGWGSLVESPRPIDATQRHLTVRVLGRDECNQPRSYAGTVPEGQFCAASSFELVDACNGFGGAGLMIPDAQGRFRLQGIVSWGNGCTRPYQYTVYTDVTRLSTWITSQTKSAAAVRFGTFTASAEVVPPPPPDIPVEGRIVSYDFNVAPIGLFRYAVSIARAKTQQTLGHFCGGVLIAKAWVLTAAHCVAPYVEQPEQLQMKADTEKLSVGGVGLKAAKVYVHDTFYRTPQGNFVNDIALVRISTNVPLDMVQPQVATADVEEELIATPEASGEVIGWGRNSSSKFGQTSDYLHRVTVKFVDRATCNSIEYYNGLIDNTVLCAGSEGIDACQGDSGGPLLILDSTGQFVVAGLVSWGDGCGKPNRPGIYVRLSMYRQWIRDTIGKATLK